jgi:hypothetical protein
VSNITDGSLPYKNEQRRDEHHGRRRPRGILRLLTVVSASVSACILGWGSLALAQEAPPSPAEVPRPAETQGADAGVPTETPATVPPTSPTAQDRAPSSPVVAEVAPQKLTGPVDAPPGSTREQAPKEAKKGPKITGAPGKGLTVTIDDVFSLNVRSRIQIRYQLRDLPEERGRPRRTEQLVNIGTARLWFSGHILTPKLTYLTQLALAGPDFRDGATSPIFDAYLDYKAHRDFNIQAGQYFVPFDRLRTVREWALQMADRPRPVAEFTLDRDAGVTFYSDHFLGDASPLAWRVGAFGGAGTNQITAKESGALVVGRLELRPLGPIDDDVEGDLERRKVPGLALGTAFAQVWNTNRLRSTTGSTFTGGTTDHTHFAADAVFKYAGFAMQAEYLLKIASIERFAGVTAAGGPGPTEFTRSGRGWVVQASYTFDPPFEVVGRLARLDALRRTDPRFVTEVDTRGQEVGTGLNYYINGHKLKLQADWIARMPPTFIFEDADHVMHLQVDATF